MSTYSSNLRLELIGTGEQQGTWGATTNTNLGTLLEQAITGYSAISVTDGADTTLTTANGASDQARNMTISLTGALTASRNVICPATPKIYIVKNATTGGYAVTFKVTGQTGVSIPNGSTVVLYVDGTDARLVSEFPVPVSQGGTGTTYGFFASGTRLLFQQTSAPTGWTKDTSNNDKALRIVSGAAGTGGTTAFSSVFTSRTPSGSISSTTSTGSIGSTTDTGTIGSTTDTGTVGATTLTIAQIPAHTHSYTRASFTTVYNKGSGTNGYDNPSSSTQATTSAGGGESHTHTLSMNAHNHSLSMNAHNHSLSMNAHNHSFTGTAMDFAVQYVDAIIAQKD